MDSVVEAPTNVTKCDQRTLTTVPKPQPAFSNKLASSKHRKVCYLYPHACVCTMAYGGIYEMVLAHW